MKRIIIIMFLLMLFLSCVNQEAINETNQTQIIPQIVPPVTSQENLTMPENETTDEIQVSPEPTTKTSIITITDIGFKPIEITINAGDTIVWKNARKTTEKSGYAYIIGSSIDCRRPKLESPYPPGIAPGETFNYTFTTPGTCTYVDGIRTTQKGTIIIK